MDTAINIVAFFALAVGAVVLTLIWALWMIKPKGNTHRLWSIWQRDRIAVQNDTFFGKSTTKDNHNNVVAVFRWMGPIAVGWYQPVSLTAVESAGMATDPAMNSLTPSIKRNV